MVEQQIRTWEVLDPEVLQLLYVVRREDFVPPSYRDLAFSDLEIPLGRSGLPSQRMWPPKLEARVLQELAVRKTETVLEIGTGSGYLTALLAHRARHVHSLDIAPDLAEFASRNLARAGVHNVTLEVADGSRGLAARAPYDVIVMTSSLPVLPPELASQLRPHGRLFAVVGDPPVMAARIVSCSADGSCAHRDLFETNLSPLINAVQPERFRF
jgi:protein-L-isoaspartate(D-aspartate) O-methyltransferase